MVECGKKYIIYTFVRGQLVDSLWTEKINNIKVGLANGLKLILNMLMCFVIKLMLSTCPRTFLKSFKYLRERDIKCIIVF